MMNNTFYNDQWSELYHYGVKGQVHGRRRYQNPDGSLTPEGYEHYGYSRRELKQMQRDINRAGHEAAQARADHIYNYDRMHSTANEIVKRDDLLKQNKNKWSEKKQEKFNKRTAETKADLAKYYENFKVSEKNYVKYKKEYDKLYTKLKNNKLLDYKISNWSTTSSGTSWDGNTEHFTEVDYNRFKIKNMKKNGKSRWNDEQRKTYNGQRRIARSWY